MVDNFLIFGGFLILFFLILYYIIRIDNKRKKEVDLKRLYKKTSFKKKNIEKNVKKNIKEKIIEYESQKQKETKKPSALRSVISESLQEPIKEEMSKTSVRRVEEENKFTSQVKASSYSFKDMKVDAISGVGASYSKRLKNAGIVTISGLLKATNNPDELNKLQSDTGIYTKMLKKWRIQADFLRIFGIGKNQIDKLVDLGIDSTYQLSSFSPDELREKMLNNYPYSEVPSLGVIKRWIRVSKELHQI